MIRNGLGYLADDLGQINESERCVNGHFRCFKKLEGDFLLIQVTFRVVLLLIGVLPVLEAIDSSIFSHLFEMLRRGLIS